MHHQWESLARLDCEIESRTFNQILIGLIITNLFYRPQIMWRRAIMRLRLRVARFLPFPQDKGPLLAEKWEQGRRVF